MNRPGRSIFKSFLARRIKLARGSNFLMRKEPGGASPMESLFDPRTYSLSNLSTSTLLTRGLNSGFSTSRFVSWFSEGRHVCLNVLNGTTVLLLILSPSSWLNRRQIGIVRSLVYTSGNLKGEGKCA
jgi:hypothetical protein